MTRALTLDEIDLWTEARDGPVAVHIREALMPVEGHGSPIFPATYAMPDRAETPYNIDTLADGTKVAAIDSVGSQANRIEPAFREPPYRDLVPQVDITYGNDRVLTIFEAGHRLGDAVVRCTALKDEAQAAFRALLDRDDAGPLAKLAPTSIVFGAWDSRDTQAKLPRLVQSAIRAWDVSPLTRSAQCNPALDYAGLAVFTEEERKKQEGNAKSELAQRGYVHVPSTGSHGGVIARGPIRRDVTVNLVALRRLSGGEDGPALRRYVLGLALVAATLPQDGFLRAGCQLVPDSEVPAGTTLVARDGRREAVALPHAVALDHARLAAARFGVGPARRVAFDREAAKRDAKAKAK